MRTTTITILILILLSMVTTACSSISSMEDKLVGEWQSKGPNPISLKIAKGATDNDGFHNGYSSTEDGETNTYDWRIEYRGERPVLCLRGKGYWDDFARRTGNSGGSEYPHRIIDLTADKFVVEWNTIYFTGSTDIKEFQRVKASGR